MFTCTSCYVAFCLVRFTFPLISLQVACSDRHDSDGVVWREGKVEAAAATFYLCVHWRFIYDICLLHMYCMHLCFMHFHGILVKLIEPQCRELLPSTMFRVHSCKWSECLRCGKLCSLVKRWCTFHFSHDKQLLSHVLRWTYIFSDGGWYDYMYV